MPQQKQQQRRVIDWLMVNNFRSPAAPPLPCLPAAAAATVAVLLLFYT